MMRTVHLYGALAKEFGPSFSLNVSSVGEAVRAIGCQIAGFQKRITEGHFRITCGPLRSKKAFRVEEREHLQLNLTGDIHIVPALAGAKRGGIGKILAGVLIAAVAWWAAPAIGGLSATLFGGFTYGNAAMFGIGMALTGVSQALSPSQKSKPAPTIAQNPSFLFNSVQNVTSQGGPVPLIYGRTLVGSVVVSAGISTEDVAV